jgi:signal transduction histidine kinase
MQRVFREKKITPREYFVQADYVEDIWQWSELVGRLLTNADLFRGMYQGLPLQPRLTLLLSEVIAPAAAQVAILLKARNLPINRIIFGDFKSIPALWLDANQFQQVIFNLLSNAIKFALLPGQFRVRIYGAKIGKDFLLWCSDEGPGIEERMKTAVFEEGFRDPARARQVSGEGLGLAVVKDVIEKHGGTIRLSSCRNPTTFEIALPESLAYKPPKRA